MTDKLIIFDYSGTLSLDMAAFANPDNLIRHLKNSGLYALGIDSELFWEIVNSTWTNGSTTQVGYKKVMQERILELFPAIAESKKPEVASAVSNFVDTYFDHSPIDDYWRPVLKEISENKTVQVIIATDHYAEATNAIIKFLKKWRINASPMKECSTNNFVVANSADIGVHKAERKFWETLQVDCGINANQILLIDDFGANEQSADAYSQEKEISQRRQKTINLLENVFSAKVEYFSFAIQEAPIADLVSQASAKITKFVSN